MTNAPKRYYLIRTPINRGNSFYAPHGANGERRNNKRVAIDLAKHLARGWPRRTPARDRRISVYTVDPGKRPTLLFQCHRNLKTGAIVSEVL